jgi:hypothetical protein
VIFIAALLHERDPRVLRTHLHRQRRAARADGERLIAQLAGEVERFERWLLARKSQCIPGHLRLDARAHRGGRPEEPVSRRETLKSLMRALEVVMLDKKAHPPLTVFKVGEHRAAEQLLPKRLPEPLDLPAGLRMVRSAFHVLDAVTLQFGFELRAAAPGGVLAALVGEDLPGRSVLSDATAQGLQHQDTALVVRHGKTHQISGVIVQERGHVDPLMTSQEERKKVRLPQLVRLRPLKVLHDLLASYPSRRGLRLDAFAPQHSTHRRLGSSKP